MANALSGVQPGARGRRVFDVMSTLVMIALASVLVWQGWGDQRGRSLQAPVIAAPGQPLDLVGRPRIGSGAARVGMIVYSDFECPYCGKFAREILPVIQSEFVSSGQGFLVFKHYPLGGHVYAPAAAAASQCGGRQGQFWAMHDRLFALPMKLAAADLRSTAERAQLDLADYDACLRDPATARVISEDSAEAQAIGLTGTPGFVFGIVDDRQRLRASDVLMGARPVAEFRAILKRLATGT
jgi:protein-disulfide isomerase